MTPTIGQIVFGFTMACAPVKSTNLTDNPKAIEDKKYISTVITASKTCKKLYPKEAPCVKTITAKLDNHGDVMYTVICGKKTIKPYR